MRLTKNFAVQQVVGYLANMGLRVSNVVSIDEYPDILRHACFFAGVAGLSRQTYHLFDEVCGVIPYTYYYCNACGKLFVQKSVYDG